MLFLHYLLLFSYFSLVSTLEPVVAAVVNLFPLLVRASKHSATILSLSVMAAVLVTILPINIASGLPPSVRCLSPRLPRPSNPAISWAVSAAVPCATDWRVRRRNAVVPPSTPECYQCRVTLEKLHFTHKQGRSRYHGVSRRLEWSWTPRGQDKKKLCWAPLVDFFIATKCVVGKLGESLHDNLKMWLRRWLPELFKLVLCSVGW